MKKLAFVLACLAGCIPGLHELTATSYTSLPQKDSQLEVAGTFVEIQQHVLEKFAGRGFPLVDRQVTSLGVLMKFAGNRDFSGASTLGSVFYVWINPTGPKLAVVKVVGKPTVGHTEGCPAMDGKACTHLTVVGDWGLTGFEEATTIHGVFSEIALDGATPELPQRTAAK